MAGIGEAGEGGVFGKEVSLRSYPINTSRPLRCVRFVAAGKRRDDNQLRWSVL